MMIVRSPVEQAILTEYQFRCVVCVHQYAVSLHEEPPKSLNPNWKNEPWTRFPLCAACHDKIQGMSRATAESILLHHQQMYFRNAIRNLKEKYGTVQAADEPDLRGDSREE